MRPRSAYLLVVRPFSSLQACTADSNGLIDRDSLDQNRNLCALLVLYMCVQLNRIKGQDLLRDVYALRTV